MSKVAKLHPEFLAEGYRFFCPGCQREHWLRTKAEEGHPACWTFNGDMDRPTFSPSLLNTLPPGTRAKADPEYIHLLCPDVCHLFVKDGQIQYLSDCTHSLAGQTVPMEDIEYARL